MNENDERLTLLKKAQQVMKKRIIDEQARAKRLESLFTNQKKLLRKKKGLVNFKEPILFLCRTNGTVEYYEDQKTKEFKVPDLPPGVEKTIYLDKNRQFRFAYAGREFHAYICHEDYAYPLNWEHNAIWVENPKTKELRLETVNLKAANVNSENLRDVMRKVLIAWEKFHADADKAKWDMIKSVIMWIVIGVIGYFVVTGWLKKGETAQAQVTAEIVNQTLQALQNQSGVVIR